MYICCKYIIKYTFYLFDILFIDFELLKFKKWNGNKIYFFFRKIFYFIFFYLPCELIVSNLLSLLKYQTWINIGNFIGVILIKGFFKICHLIMNIIFWILETFIWLVRIDKHYERYKEYKENKRRNRRIELYLKQFEKREKEQKKLELKWERIIKRKERKLKLFYFGRLIKEYIKYILYILFIPFYWLYQKILRKIWYPAKINIIAIYQVCKCWWVTGFFKQYFLLIWQLIDYYFWLTFGKLWLTFQIRIWIPLVCRIIHYPSIIKYALLERKYKIIFIIISIFRCIGKVCDFFWERLSFRAQDRFRFIYYCLLQIWKFISYCLLQIWKFISYCLLQIRKFISYCLLPIWKLIEWLKSKKTKK
jgi:hypothetical protein